MKLVYKHLIAGLLATSLPAAAEEFRSITPDSVDSLQNLLAEEEFVWPPNGKPTLLVKELPDDFDQIQDVRAKKQLFIRLMTPIILAENRRIAETRALLELVLSGPIPEADSPAGYWLEKIKKRYKVSGKKLSDDHLRRILLNRVDQVPTTLVMAQAAIESGWGTSRFALEGNSLFGQWTWEKGGGLTPEDRDHGASHQVAAFESLRASVRAYMNNLNTHRAYSELRQMREQMRAESHEPDGYTLAAGLHRYSQRGEHYVEELRAIMDSADFRPLRELTLQVARAESTGD